MLNYCFTACFLLFQATAVLSPVFGASNEKIEVPLFLFSGQSNMVCLGSAVSDLPSEDKNKRFENIRIHNRSDKAYQEWSTLEPGFGGDRDHFGPELYFGKVLADSMPDTKIAFIKDATSGTYLGQSGGWLPPSSGGPGTLYRNMMNHIDDALEQFNDAFDTSRYSPRWAGFIWHQGEFDAWNDRGLAEEYEENLTNLVNDIREMAGDDSMPAIIPMITGTMWQYQNIVRDAECAVAEKLVNADTMDTDGYALSRDNIHFNAESQMKIGTICAERWLAMEYCNEWWTDTIPTPVAYRPVTTAVTAAPLPSSGLTFFDLSGRKIRRGRLQQPSSFLMLLQNTASGSAKRHTSKTVLLQ